MLEEIKKIQTVYKALLLYEDVKDVNSEVTESDYLSYLNRIFVLFSKNKEISEYIGGLIALGVKATHANVKATVFHIIRLVDKGGVEDRV